MKKKELFFAYMAHEIRTFMNGINGLTDLLAETDLAPEQKEYVSTIKSLGDTLTVVVNDILDMSKIDAGKMSFEKVPFSITNNIDAIIKTFLPKANEKNIRLRKQIDTRLPPTLFGDPFRLNQVLMNLVSNAIKYTDEGEVVISVNVKSDQHKVMVEFLVSDTGRGIPEEKIDSLFEDYVQAHSDSSSKYGGTGLGLALTKRLIDLQNGEIAVESKEGQGSSFIVTLAFDRQDELQKKLWEESADKTQKAVDSLMGCKILLIDDNPVSQLLGRKILSDVGAVVETADSGKNALIRLKEKKFDLILMDIEMPEMDGLETTRIIRNEMSEPAQSTTIVALSAHSNADQIEKCFKAGMDDYVLKPFNPYEISQVRLRNRVKIMR